MDSEFQAKWKKDGESMKYTWKGDTMVLNFPDGSSFDLVLSDATLSLLGSWGGSYGLVQARCQLV